MDDMQRRHIIGLLAGAAMMGTMPLTAWAQTSPTVYTVKPGDSVWKIARAHGVPMKDVILWNHLLHPNVIYPGQVLRLSAPSTANTIGQASAKPGLHLVSYTPSTTVGNPGSSLRQDIVNYAKTFVGAPYRYGGESPAGFDCSGLVQTVFAHFHIALPRTAAAQHTVGTSVSKAALQPGDLVFFNTTGQPYSHDGIYIGNGQFISATTSHGVVISELDNPYYWGPRFTGATDPLAP
jgi:peptidoglycan endopeptidase LytE